MSEFGRRTRRTRRRSIAVVAAVVTAGALTVTPTAAAAVPADVAASSAADVQPNPAPAVIPAVRSWQGSHGQFTLTPRSRIVATGSKAVAEAHTLADDLATIAGHPIRIAGYSKAHRGDIALVLAPHAGADPESYRLDIGDSVTLTAPTATGLSRGAQTIEQMLRLDPRHVGLPKGTAADSPRVAHRGVMIDAARKYYQPSYIRQLIRTAAWYKLNTVHLHLSEYNAFRLDSPKFPGLAPAQSYDHDDIRSFEAVASRYHIDIIPEIDLPAHSTAIANYWPQTKWDCPSMGNGYTLDYTKPATRKVVKELLDEFIPWFNGAKFHIGTDETPAQPAEDNCPELVKYAKDKGYGSTSDPLVEFIDYLNGIVRSHGKQAVMWGAWDVNQTPTIDPDKNIIVEAWNSSPQQYLDKGYQVISSPSNLLYATPGAPPGSSYEPNVEYLYSQWQPSANPNLIGYSMSRWSDGALNTSDAYLDWFARRGQQVLADRTWGGPRHGNWLDFETRADRIGPPPGVPGSTPDAVKLSGTPYGTAPWNPENPSPASNVFDGDPNTFFDAADANGAYAGIDLGAGNAATVTKIRFLPRSGQEARMIGGRFEGCTDGPTSGCTVLADIPWNPAHFDWRQLTVSNPGSYRWLRYVAPDGGFGNVAEVQFYTAPSSTVTVQVSAPSQLRALGENVVTTTLTNRTDRPLHQVTAGLAVSSLDSGTPLQVKPIGRGNVPALPPHRSATIRWSVAVPLGVVAGTYRVSATVATEGIAPRQGGTDRSNASVLSDISNPIAATVKPSPLVVDQGTSAKATLTLTSTAAAAAHVAWTAEPANGITLTPASGEIDVPAGGSASVPLTVTAASTARGATETPITVSANGVRLAGATLRVSVPYANLAQAFDNVGITADNDVHPADLAGGIDGDGSSLSQQALAAAGAAPGGRFSYGGLTFTWPAAVGTPDNVVANGQNVLVGKAGNALGMLVTGTYVAPGTFDGTATITYTDGSTQPFQVSVPEWQRGYTAPADEAITMNYHNWAPVGQANTVTHVFFVSADLDPGKTVESITLPLAPGGRAALHVFSLAVG